MKHPDKWRETADSISLPYRQFQLTEVLGYPHAGNDVFHVRGVYQSREVTAFVKAARQTGADLRREAEIIRKLHWPLAPEVIDFDEAEARCFLEGYESAGSYDVQAVKYHLAQIYAHFYCFSGNEPEYLRFIEAALHRICTQ